MKNKSFKARIAILTTLIVFVVFFYSIRLINLQIVNGENYLNEINRGTSRSQSVQAARGEIVDRNGVPFTRNRVSYDIIFDRAFLPRTQEVDIIMETIKIVEKQGEEWIDNLPLTKAFPLEFEQGKETAVKKLQTTLNVGSYTSAKDVSHWLKERYNLQDYNDEIFRKVAGVKYSMELAGFSISNQYVFAEDVSIQTATLIKELGYKLAGVDIVERAVREYSGGNLIPHIIGRTGPIYAEELEQKRAEGYKDTDYVGKDGIELLYEKELRGIDGTRTIYLNSGGSVVDVIEEQPPKPGNTIQLTIDSEIQRAAMESLEKQIKFLNETAPAGEGKEADAGAIAAIQVKTGDILSLVTYPSYDQNTYSADYAQLISDPLNPLYNRALMGRYAPGSTFKPAVALGALNENLETRESTVFCGHIYTHFSDYQPKCLGTHSSIDVVRALRVSCNIYFYDTGRRLGIDKINQYASALGLAEPTGIELREFSGQLSSPETAKSSNQIWTPGNVIASAIGQGYNSFSPLQLANYTATLANRGKRMDLNIVKSVNSYNLDSTFSQKQPQVISEMNDVRPEAFETVIDGMVEASRIGTAARYFGNYFVDVASKTGTPETSEFPNSVFIAFAPAEDPEIAILVIIERGWHGYTGAPVAKDIFNKYFELYGEGDTLPPEIKAQREKEAAEKAAAEKAAQEEKEKNLQGETPQSPQTQSATQGETPQSPQTQSAAQGETPQPPQTQSATQGETPQPPQTQSTAAQGETPTPLSEQEVE